MVIKKRQILWDWTNTSGPGNPGVPDKIEQVKFGTNSPVASVVNWNAWVPPELKGRVPFRPMVRVLESTQGNDWNIIKDTPFNTILFFNEPERAGISPEKARDIWYAQMLPLRKNKGKKLGSPAVASDENGRKWIEKFMSLVANDKPDFLCLHYYSKNADDAIKYLEDMHGKWPKLKVMVTEIACIDRNYQAVLKYSVKICNWMDQKDWIAEYGLFDFQRKVADDFVSPAAQLMDSKGNFTELGKMYCHQQPMKLPSTVKGFSIASATDVTDDAPDAPVEPANDDDEKKEAEDVTDATAKPVNGDDENKKDEVAVAGEDTKTGEPIQYEPKDGEHESPAQEDDTQEVVGVMSVMSVAAALGSDQQKALNAHNNKRKGKNLPALTWDASLASQATKYAQHLAKIGKLQHSSGDERPNQGENLAWSLGVNKPPLENGTQMWLNEEKNYHGERIGEGNFGSYGHYTQCMWKSTKKLGMGSAKDAKGGIYVVARYSPPGNWSGQKPY